MHILLINTNPVVSRLFYDISKDDDISIDEIDSMDNLKDECNYDIVFVDEESYREEQKEFLFGLDTLLKVFFSYKSDEMIEFDRTLSKPFLPSQIIDIISDVKEQNRSSAILDIDELEKIKDLLNMSEESNGIKTAKEELCIDDCKLSDNVYKKSSIKIENRVKKQMLIEEAVKFTIKNLTKKQKKKLLKGKEIEIKIKLKGKR